jgi:hypothetical protein
LVQIIRQLAQIVRKLAQIIRSVFGRLDAAALMEARVFFAGKEAAIFLS